MSSSKVRLASSIIAHSSPCISMPWPAKRAGSTRRGSLPSSSSPSEFASRLAGSIVTTATRVPCGGEAHRQRRRGRRLAHAARARADDDALAGQARPHSARSSSRARRAMPRRRRGEDERQRHDRGTRAGGAGAQLRALRAGARVGVARARATSGRRAPPRARARRRRRSGRAAAVGDDEVDLEADVLAQRGLQRERLVDRHLLGPRHRDDAGPLGVGEHRVDHPALAGDAAHARGLGERARRGQHRDAVAGRGRVEDDEVVGVGAGRAAVLLGELPDLADGQQLAQPRRRGGEVAEGAAGEPAGRPAPPGAGRRGTPPSPPRGRSRCGAGRAPARPRACPCRRARARRRRAARPRRRSSAARAARPRARARRRPSTCRRRPCR